MEQDEIKKQEEPVCRPCAEKNKIIESSIVAGQVNYGLLDKAKNLIKGIEGNVKQDFVDGIVFLKRKHICKGCNHRLNVLTMTYNPNEVSKSDKCMACDCFLTARVGPVRGKLWLRNQSCPLGKWGEVKNNLENS